MRRRPLLPLLLLTLGIAHAGAPAYGAPGVNLRWYPCLGDGGTQNRTFACDSNSGTEVLLASFVPATGMAHVIGLEFVLDLASASAALPPWWDVVSANSCRRLSLFARTDNSTSVNCPAWSAGDGTALVGSYVIGARGPNTARITGVSGIPLPAPGYDLLSAQEYSAFQLLLRRDMTVGAGSCAGCEVPVCIVFSGLKLLAQLPNGSQSLTGPTNLTDSDFVTWQGGGVPDVGGVTGCPAATPARPSTWGSVKALYR